MRSPALFRVLVASLAIGSVSAQLSTLPVCAQTCVNNMLAKATSLGCTSAADTSCLCASSGFSEGAKDCATQACGASVEAEVDTYLKTMCASATATLAKSTTAADAAGAAKTTAAGADAAKTTAAGADAAKTTAAGAAADATKTTAAGAAADAAKTTAAGAAGAAATATTPAGVAAAATDTAAAGVAGTSTTPAAAVGTGGVGTGTNSTMTASGTAAHGATITPTSTLSSNSSNHSSNSSGLSNAAKIGLGVGIGAVVLGVIAIAAIFVSKKNKGPSEYNDKFSVGPMASAGSQFGFSSTHQRIPEPGASTTELKATRYEDMVPRAAPRNMV